MKVKLHPNKITSAREALLSQIKKGAYGIGQRIPPEPQLVGVLGVSRNTLREAVSSLVHDGVLDRRQGSGTYVVGTKTRPFSDRLTELDTVRIGLVLPRGEDFNQPNSYLLGLLKGLNEPVAGYPRVDVRYLTWDASFRGMGGVHFLDAVEAGTVDALVVTVVELDLNELDRAIDSGVPVVFTGIECTCSRLAFVQSNLAGGSSKLVDHLCRAGQTAIGFLMDIPRGRSAAAFFSGAVAAYTRLGLAPDLSRTAYIGKDRNQIPKRVDELLAAGSKTIVCFDDDTAETVVRYLTDRGLHVPRDVLVTGANDTSKDGFLTTLRIPLEKMGRTVRDLVFEGLRTGTVPVRTVTFEPELIVRQSTGEAK